jgi:hypothetical protein
LLPVRLLPFLPFFLFLFLARWIPTILAQWLRLRVNPPRRRNRRSDAIPMRPKPCAMRI